MNRMMTQFSNELLYIYIFICLHMEYIICLIVSQFRYSCLYTLNIKKTGEKMIFTVITICLQIFFSRNWHDYTPQLCCISCFISTLKCGDVVTFLFSLITSKMGASQRDKACIL